MMNKKNVYKLFLFLFMLLAFFISVYPLLWVVIQSLKTETEFLESIWTLPARLNFQNYATAWNDAGMSRYFMNSVVVTLVTTAVNLVFVTCAGYAFAKLKFPGKTFFYYMIIFNLLIPTAIILLPMFTMVNRMHLVNTLPALVFPYFQGFAPMGLIICRNYFEDLPDELMEAGKLDGCSNMQVFRKIMLPLAKPILAVISIYTIVITWNSWFNALVYLPDTALQPLQLYLRRVLLENTVDLTKLPMNEVAEAVRRSLSNVQLKYAMIIFTTLPVLFAYPFFQKHFVKGIMVGSLKG